MLLNCDATSSVTTSDVGLSNLLVTLSDANSNALSSMLTGTNGTYAFTNLAPGTYIVSVTPPSNSVQTLDFDSVLDNQTTLTLAGCQHIANVIFGYADTSTPVIVDVASRWGSPLQSRPRCRRRPAWARASRPAMIAGRSPWW